jgi:hypothetical protein
MASVFSDPDWEDGREDSRLGIRIGGKHYNLREPRKINYSIDRKPGQFLSINIS